MKSDLTEARASDPGLSTEKPADGGDNGSKTTPTWKPQWTKWARSLRRLGMGDLAASLLEEAGALNILNAQLIYLSQPMLGLILADEDLSALAQTLEEPERVKAFASLIREEGTL